MQCSVIAVHLTVRVACDWNAPWALSRTYLIVVLFWRDQGRTLHLISPTNRVARRRIARRKLDNAKDRHNQHSDLILRVV